MTYLRHHPRYWALIAGLGFLAFLGGFNAGWPPRSAVDSSVSLPTVSPTSTVVHHRSRTVASKHKATADREVVRIVSTQEPEVHHGTLNLSGEGNDPAPTPPEATTVTSEPDETVAPAAPTPSDPATVSPAPASPSPSPPDPTMPDDGGFVPVPQHPDGATQSDR